MTHRDDGPPRAPVVVRSIEYRGEIYLHRGELVAMLLAEAAQQTWDATQRTIRHVARHIETC